MAVRDRAAWALLLLAPAGAIAYLGFNAGGFFPGAPAFAALAAVQLLILRLLVAEEPFAGLSRPLVVAIAAFGAYCLWVLASALWSGATSRALIEFDRALLYLVVLVLAGSVGRTPGRLRWLARSVVLGIFVVCIAAFVSRTFPNLVHVRPGLANSRLSYPVTYSNSLGLMAAIGAIFAFAFAADERDSRVMRVIGAACVPLFLVTLFLTFSRGAMIAAVVGAIVFAIAGRPRAIATALLAVVPTSVIALIVAYQANLLAGTDPTTAAAARQGHHLALVTGTCCVAAALLRLLGLRLDQRLANFRLSPERRRPVIGGSVAAGAVALVVVALIAGVPGTLSTQYHNFVSHPLSTSSGNDFRSRLTALDNGYRLEFWKAALKGFDASPFHGTGAGTYNATWLEKRPTPFFATNAHSLYLETLSELGLVGVALLVLALGTIAVRLGSYSVGRDRVVYAGILAAFVTWLLHVGADWDWNMPAATIWVFALGGLALAAPTRTAAARTALGFSLRPPLSDGTRVVMALCVLGAVVPPALITISQGPLESGVASLNPQHCVTAQSKARSSISVLADRPEPYLILGLCDVMRGNPTLAVPAMQQAVSRDPDSWEAQYALAAAQASAGQDPRRAAANARRMNPLEPLTVSETQTFATSNRSVWVKQGPQVATALVASGVSSVSRF